MIELRQNEKKELWIFFALLYAAAIAINRMTPMMADDYIFCLSRVTWQRITGFREIIDSLRKLRNFNNGNGRVIAHFFAYFFLFYSREAFVVINSFNWVAQVWLIIAIVSCVQPSDVRKSVLAFFAAAGLWVLVPAWGQVYVWLTGACNYSWAMTMIALFLLPFVLSYSRGRDNGWSRCKLWQRLLFVPIAFMAGAWSESGSSSMIGIAFLFMIHQAVREKKMPEKHLIAYFISACGGFAFLMLCPSELLGRAAGDGASTLSRFADKYLPAIQSMAERLRLDTPAVLAAVIAGILAVTAAAVFSKKFRKMALIAIPVLVLTAAGVLMVPEGIEAKNLTGTIMAVVSDVKISLIIMLLANYLLFVGAVIFGADKEKLMAAMFFTAGAIASVGVFAFAIYFAPRSGAYAAMYTLISDMILFLAIREKRRKTVFRLFPAALLLVFAMAVIPGTRELIRTDKLGEQRNAILEQASVDGTEKVVLEHIFTDSKYSPLWPGDHIYYDGDMSLYYGIPYLSIDEYLPD